MNRTAEERIVNNKKRKRQVYKILRSVYYDYDLRRDWIAKEEIWQRAKRYRDNLHMCSCPVCGNKRRAMGKTIQEKRIAEYENEALLEYEGVI